MKIVAMMSLLKLGPWSKSSLDFRGGTRDEKGASQLKVILPRISMPYLEERKMRRLLQTPPIVVEKEIQVVETKEQVSFAEMECGESIALQEIAVDWWGTKYGFVRSEVLGSKVRETFNGERPSQNGRTQFSEQDQENLYNLVNDKATGMKGLGQGERALKIEGVKTTSRPGQKKVFANVEGSDEDEVQEAVTNDSQGEPAKLEKKRKRDETSGNESSLQEGSKIKLKELVAQFLTEASGQRMSFERLQKRISASTGSFSSKDDTDSYRDKLLKSSRFVVDGKKVSLKSRP